MTYVLGMPLIITHFPTGKTNKNGQMSHGHCLLPLGKSVIIRVIPRNTFETKA